MANPKITVVIPAYNSEKFIMKSVESAVLQSPQPYEIIVVDSGPEKQSEIIKALAQRYPCVVPLVMPPKGISAARNLGVMKATGDTIVFLDADDFLTETYMSEMTQLALDNPGMVLAPSLTYTSTMSGRTVGYIECVPNERRSLRPGEHIMAFPSGLWAPRDLLLRHGRFDENLSTGEDGGTIERISAIAGFRGSSKILVRNGINPIGLTNEDPLKKDLFLELSYINNERNKVKKLPIPSDIFDDIYKILANYLHVRKDLEALARKNSRLTVLYYLDRRYGKMIKHLLLSLFYHPKWVTKRMLQKLSQS